MSSKSGVETFTLGQEASNIFASVAIAYSSDLLDT
jgi:hypothetical protein